MLAKKIGITDTTLRDAQQSLIATRMKTSEMIPVAEMIDKVGFHSVEMWGGATFDSCIRFLDEDPWERIRVLKKYIKKTKFQMLLRGQNLVGYHHYPDDVVREFIKRAVGNGIDIFRVFDALNDTRNMEVAAETIKSEGAHLQLAISYTISPVHSIETYVKIAGDLVSIGADSLCIKDMAGLLTPTQAFRLVKGIKENYDIPLQVHTHCTSGMGTMTYLKAVEAGADIIDTAISPFATGTSQPATESMVTVLKETNYDTGLNLGLLSKIAKYFKKIRNTYKDAMFDSLIVDANVLLYQIPGGMYSNLVSQLKGLGVIDKIEEVLEEIPRVRKDLGYPPLVTPISQIVGTQATLNVISGERYKIIPNEVRDYVRGLYGKPPAPVDPEIKRKAIGDEEPINCRPADLLKPGLKHAKSIIGDFATQPEDILTYALFPDTAKDFLLRKYTRKNLVDIGLENTEEDGVYPV